MVKHRVSIEATASEHRQWFADFCRAELNCGGPDPHLAMVVAASTFQPLSERIWRAGCYVVPYTTASAAAIWAAFPRAEDLLLLSEGALERWLTEHKAGLPIRAERRAVWGATKFAECLRGYARWTMETGATIAELGSFEDAWNSATTVKYLGRYALIKLLETLWRLGVTRYPMNDICPDGAWSPRLTLSFLYPQYADLLTEENTGWARAMVDAIAADLKASLPMELTWYQLEVFLCNYRQTLNGGYARRAHDTEQVRWIQASEADPDLERGLDFYGIRRQLFDRRCLGEYNGWTGPRPALAQVFADHRYFWDDTVHDYRRTVEAGDFGHPVLYEAAL